MLFDDLANVELLQMHFKLLLLGWREVEQLGGRDHFGDFDHLNFQYGLRHFLF